MTSTVNTKKKSLSTKAYNALSDEEKSELRKAKLDAAQADYDSALTALVEGDRFRGYLEAAANCHSYSLLNTMWVLFQREGNCVPPIASFPTWKKKLGYSIRKGEVSASVWVPVQIKFNDPDAEDADEDGKVKRTRFKPGPVFTRDQVEPVEGKALSIDPPRPEPVEGNSHAGLIPTLHAFIGKQGLGFKELASDNPQGALGYHSKEEKVIACRTDIAPNAQVRVLIHELIHSLGIGYREYGRERAETITDSATYIACRSLGLDVEKSSIPYVAGWAGSKASEIRDDLALMSNLADQILAGSGLDEHLALSEAEQAMRSGRKAIEAKKRGPKTA